METSRPLLRAPPFPGADASVTQPCGAVTADLTPDAIDQLFAVIRDARVGGAFWAPHSQDSRATLILRARSSTEVDSTLAALPEAERASTLWVPPASDAGRVVPTPAVSQGFVATGPIDPWSVLDRGVALVAHGDDEWVALGVIAGARVHLLSEGRFGAPGDDVARLRSIVAGDLMCVRYRDPFFARETSIEAVVALLSEWRGMFEANRTIIAACGFSWWKRPEIARFLWTPEHALRFFWSERRALAYAARHGGAVAIWPSRVSGNMAATAAAKSVALIRVEDGFIRSAGLGSNLVPPSSVAVDRRGIHYDPGGPSDLEALLADSDFPPALLARAARLRTTILEAGISKYGSDAGHAFPARRNGSRLVLVPGQVEDDMSVRLGGGGVSTNLELLRRARAREPDAEIWFRPHPDVIAGHRKGAVSEADALEYADRIVQGGGMAALLDQVDAVHVLTSLTGFEALLRGREVACHGTPFYAGWGLTRDFAPVPGRRGRHLTLEQLIAAVLIVYPRYLDPVTGLPCAPEVLIQRIGQGAARNRLGWVTRFRQMQGRLRGQRA